MDRPGKVKGGGSLKEGRSRGGAPKLVDDRYRTLSSGLAKEAF